MAKPVDLLTLRTKSRERADMENSQFISDSELTGYINSSKDELWDLLTSSNEDYSLTQLDVIVPSGGQIDLPDDFYKLRGVDDLSDSSNPISVLPFNFAERNDFSPLARAPLGSKVRYHLIGNVIAFYPPENGAGEYTIWYTPILVDLSADGDELDGVSGWEEYVIVDAAIKCLLKEESSTTALETIKDGLKKRILRMAPRDQGQVRTISRVRNKGQHRSRTAGW